MQKSLVRSIPMILLIVLVLIATPFIKVLAVPGLPGFEITK